MKNTKNDYFTALYKVLAQKKDLVAYKLYEVNFIICFAFSVKKRFAL